jgi:hypothetical protein
MYCLDSLIDFFLIRVQDASNEIQWTYAAGDPTPVDIIVTNQANQTLNGAFSIARFVPVSQEVWLASLSFPECSEL